MCAFSLFSFASERSELDLLAYGRAPYEWLLWLPHTYICYVDGLGQVAETDETDNYAIVREFAAPVR